LNASKDLRFPFAAKVVRGAYLQAERSAAAASGRACAVWSSKEETDAAYDK